jgi:hypothetical protein
MWRALKVNSVNKRVNELNRQFSKEEQMESKYMKKCWTSLHKQNANQMETEVPSD